MGNQEQAAGQPVADGELAVDESGRADRPVVDPAGDPAFENALDSAASGDWERPLVAAALVGEAEQAALVHHRLAEELWHRSGGGHAAVAHRLASSVLLSLVHGPARCWRLAPLVRDLVALGEPVLPASLEAMAAEVESTAGRPYRSVVERVAGGLELAERRYRAVVDLAGTIARQVAVAP
jgi:hypothetical protein